MSHITLERVEELRGRLMGMVEMTDEYGGFKLDRDDRPILADLLAILNEKAEQLKAGGIGTEGDNGVSPRTRLGSTPSADAPGPTDEERREMVEWLDEMVKSFEIIGTHPRHIETPKAIRRLILSSPAKSPEGASVSREWFLRRAHDIIRGRDSGAEAAFEFALNDLGITVEDSEEEKGRNP